LKDIAPNHKFEKRFAEGAINENDWGGVREDGSGRLGAIISIGNLRGQEQSEREVTLEGGERIKGSAS